MPKAPYDFEGYVTKNDLLCSDGRVIRRGAFENCDGRRVPLVWNHDHSGPENILGHADLEYRKDGVYGHCALNDTERGELARQIVKHGDVVAMSIYANQLQQNGNEVVHGTIREVSLVLAGANPGAYIENKSIQHADGYGNVDVEVFDEEATISYVPEDARPLELAHAAPMPVDEEEDEPMDNEDDPTILDIVDTMTDEQKTAMYALIGAAVQGVEESQQSDEEEDTDYDEDEMGQSAFDEDDHLEHDESDEEDYLMNNNVFENQGAVGDTLQQSAIGPEEMEAIFDEARRIGSLKEAAIQHDAGDLMVINDNPMPGYGGYLQHGVQQIDVLFPEVHNVTPTPATIKRPMEWVSGVLGGVQKSPFNRIKSMAFDLTEEEARARGYIKGKKKIEEQIKALKRTTTPQTVYKLQKLDRDDIIDITDFDIVAYLKSEMRMMLDEELARAVLVGDGRTAVDESKIKEDNIRPIWGDDEVYTIHNRRQTKPSTPEEINAFIDDIIRAHKNYKGSGQPTLYIGTDLLTEMRLLKDGDGYRRYKTDAELASDLRVSKIVEVQLLDGLKRQANGKEIEFGALIVNLRDYTMGATRGGQVTLFDDFDLNYNKQEYLIETRCCGALTQPASALAFEFGEAED